MRKANVLLIALSVLGLTAIIPFGLQVATAYAASCCVEGADCCQAGAPCCG